MTEPPNFKESTLSNRHIFALEHRTIRYQIGFNFKVRHLTEDGVRLDDLLISRCSFFLVWLCRSARKQVLKNELLIWKFQIDFSIREISQLGSFHKLRKHVFGSFWPYAHPNINNVVLGNWNKHFLTTYPPLSVYMICAMLFKIFLRSSKKMGT